MMRSVREGAFGAAVVELVGDWEGVGCFSWLLRVVP